MSLASLQIRAKAEIELRQRMQTAKPARELGWREWLYSKFPSYITSDFSQHHIELWEWLESLERGVRPRPFVGIWPRGGAKSTSGELGAVRIGEKRTRRYVWYVSSTQEKADKHVASIADMLEGSGAQRALNKYGSSKGWRRERLRAANGFTVDGLGLDVGSRGAKMEEQRPDMIILDDFDEDNESAHITYKKIDTITKSILPAGSNDCAVLVIQNLIHVESIASRLVDGRADFLIDRIISGPFPAIQNLTYEFRYDKEIGRKRYFITGGTAIWSGQSLEICQKQINDWGLSAFLQEAQHEVDKTGGLWDHIEFQHFTFDERPDYIRTTVWVDPAVTSTDKSDSMGISAGGIQESGMIDGLFWWEAITSPEDALRRAIRKAIEIRSMTVGVETDQGGDTWQSVYYLALEAVKAEIKGEVSEEEYDAMLWPSFVQAKAGAGFGSKAERNAKMLSDYERGRVRHMVGTNQVIERALRRFPNKPLDVADSQFWMWNDLRGRMSAADMVDFA